MYKTYRVFLSLKADTTYMILVFYESS